MLVVFLNHRNVYSGAEKVLIDLLENVGNVFSYVNIVPNESTLLAKCIEHRINYIVLENLVGFSDLSKIAYFRKLLRSYLDLHRKVPKKDVFFVANTLY